MLTYSTRIPEVLAKTMPSSLQPRKQPSQARSRATVDTILEAAARNLTAPGRQRFSTNAVAELAGVSIGTLYQYFRSKEAILAELGRRHAEEMNRRVIAALEQVNGHDLDGIVRTLITAFIDAHAAEPVLHLALIGQHGGQGHRHAMLGEIDAMELVRKVLARHLPNLDRARLETAAFVAATLVHETIHAAVRERPDLLGSEEFAEMLARAVRGCLASQPIQRHVVA